MTLPQVLALQRYWSHTPPVAFQLRRIALFLGLQDPPAAKAPDAATPRSLDNDLRDLSYGGIPIFEGRPNDPMLDLLDL